MTNPEIPSELRAIMADIGPCWGSDPSGNIQLMLDKFSEVLKDAPKDGVTVQRDVSYGDHSRQRLDIYKPKKNSTPRAALLFVHGGAFVEGHRNRTDEIYANALYYFARNGIVGINIGYRLASDGQYPVATHDVASAVAWAHAHAEKLNIDRSRIFLMGHSAGAAHTGSYAYDKRLQPSAGPGLAGFIVVSGRVRAETRPENPNRAKVVTYYGTSDAAKLDDVSPVSHVNAESVPTFVAWGEYENPLVDVHCAELVFKLAVAKGRVPPMMWLRGHNHTSTMAHFNTAEEALGLAILDFIANPR